MHGLGIDDDEALRCFTFGSAYSASLEAPRQSADSLTSLRDASPILTCLVLVLSSNAETMYFQEIILPDDIFNPPSHSILRKAACAMRSQEGMGGGSVLIPDVHC